MNIFIHVIGKVKDEYLKLGISDYITKISKYAKISFVEYKDFPINKNASKKEEELIKDKECRQIIDSLKPTDYVVSLDLGKKEFTSEEFAKWMDDTFIKSHSSIHFIIGGSLGLSKEMKERSNDSISLSKLTFLHGMTRLILLEQIYRAYKINNNEVYHK